MFVTKIFPLLLIFLTLGPISGQVTPAAEVQLGSAMVVVGEETYLTLITTGITILDWPVHPPEVRPLALQPDAKKLEEINHYIREVYRYRIWAFEPGIYQIPPFEFRSGSQIVRSNPLVLRVFPRSDLSTHGIKISSAVTPYLTGLFLEKSSPYLGEAQDVEAKLYLSQAPPNRLRLYDGKVIKIEKDGLAAWRLTTDSRLSGILNLDGQRFQVYSYKSTVSAFKEGPLKLGPGNAGAIFYWRANQFAHTIQFPSADLTVRPLPAGAPDEFSGAVGRFSMNIVPLDFEIELGDTLTVEAKISGSGNLTQFPGPTLIDPDEQWKQFKMVAKPSGSERRSSSGTVEYSQVVRPLSKSDRLPPYRFAYFDPLLERYQTLESPAIPITMTGEAPTELSSEDTLAFLTPGGRPLKSFAKTSPPSLWLWHLAPASLSLFFVIMGLKRRMVAKKMARQPKQVFQNELAKVGDQAGDRASFYREAARFATEWRAEDGFDEIFETRDEVCFRPDTVATPVEEDEKSRILELLKTLCPLLVIGFLSLLQITPLAALEPDHAKMKAEILAQMKEQPAREHFHNLALCEKALGKSGQAALWAYRFQLHGGDAEALLSDLPGSRVEVREGADWFSLLGKDWYFQMIWAGLWGCLLILFTIKFAQGKLRQTLLILFAIFSPSALLLGGLGIYFYPDEISFEPLQELSVVTGTAPMRTQPFGGAKEMRATLEGSLCKVTASRGGWTKLILPGGLSGWVREDAVESILTP